MDSILQWVKVAGLIWGIALVVALAAELRSIRRLIPGWLRSVSRVLVLIGTIAAVTLGVLTGIRLLTNDMQAQAGGGSSYPISLSFDSPNTFFVSLYLLWSQRDLSRPAGADATPVTFVVSQGETASSVTARLEAEGLVVSGDLLRRFLAYRGEDASLQAGTYRLQASMTIPEVAEALQHGSVESTTVTIPEGWRAEQIGWLLEQQGLLRSDDFLAQVRSGDYSYSWLAQGERCRTLEGFLFPDTYQFPKETSAAEVVGRMVANLDARAGSDLEAGIEGKQVFDIGAGAYRDLTVCDVVTLASIVEREAQVPEERPIIASVYLNRLDPAFVNQTALRLSSDPTVQYAKGYDPKTGSWWNPMLPGEGLTLDSPYNTFRVQGFPPGPICNPGLASIEAVLNPAKTSYLYFQAKGDGSHAFAATLEDHLRNQQLYGSP